MLIAVVALTYFISRSKTRLYLSAGGEEPEAAMALGVNVARCKLIAMAMSSFLTAWPGPSGPNSPSSSTQERHVPRHFF